MKNPLHPIMILLLALPLPASAACVTCTCNVSASGVSFGTYNPISGSNAENAGNVRINCGGAAGTVNYTIQLNQGIYSSRFSPRQMGSGSNRLNYDLYTDPAHTIVWGDGSAATGFISGSLNVLPQGSSRDHIVYGRIPARQKLAGVGGYGDTITITVTYQ
ncbi:MAG TPA: spore coat U domain-containing protein [Gallionellaceae bacterium]